MARRYLHGLGLLMAVTLWLTLPASAAVIHKDIAELTAEAQQILLGDVIEVTSFWDDQHALIKSQIVVHVDQYLLGTGSGTEVLTMSGGTVGDLTLRVSVLPVFEPGDHVLLFLGDSVIRLVEAYQGAFLTDGQQVVQMGPACVRTIAETLQPLSDLLDQIQAALPEGVRLPPLLPSNKHFTLPIGQRYSLCGPNWTYKTCPMGEDHKINPNCADASAGDAASQVTQIENGFGGWNNAGADFVFTYGGQTTLANVVLDGTNLIYFDLTPPDGGDYVAATYYWASGNNITEVDLVFNDQSYTWWNGSGSCGGNKMDIWNTTAHESGHWLCLADLCGGGDTEKTMYGYVDYCETKKRTLESDDVNGIKAIYGIHESTPPSPDPMTWSSAPAPTSTTAISMTATTATDATPPVQYYFHFVSGGSGGTDSSWQSGTSYNDTGLSPNTSYSYQVKAHDGACPPNETAYSDETATATYIQTLTGITFGTVTSSSIDLQANGTLTNLTLGQSGVYFDSTTSGGDGGINEWVQVITDTATGLTPNTQYTFRAKARNQNAIETAYGPSASKYTLAEVPAAPTLANITINSMTLDVDPGTNPAGTQFAIHCLSADTTWNGSYVDATGHPSSSTVWQTDALWGTLTVQDLDPNTEYCFQVKARNADLVETAYSPQACAQTIGTLVYGDLNCDGEVNFGDINPFVMALANPEQWEATYPCDIHNGDINQDGNVNFGDINPFVSCLSTGHCP